VNIDFDFGKKEKIGEYIPTSDICDVLSFFVSSVERNRDNSTFLIGPYGKGKSFLVLVLSQILSGKADKKSVESLCRKITPINQKLSDSIAAFSSSQKKYLPVIVTSEYDNLKQSFLVALRKSLDSNGFSGLVPRSSYDVCLDILNKWTGDPTISGTLKACASKTRIEDIKEGLHSYSPKAYKDFESLYNCVSIGQQFNPLIGEDVPRIFSNVAATLKAEGKCDGVLVIFDEFSKFLESITKNEAGDLRFIQDFAEAANRSDANYSLHLCCIAHKPITQYAQKGTKTGDMLRTVEGRFLTVRFNRGMKENLELIGSAIVKKPGFDNAYEGFAKRNEGLISSLLSLDIFKSEKGAAGLFKSCFPINPLSAVTLIRVSELVAQNERTLFTFISGDDASGLRRFICSDHEEMVDSSYVYDYFSDQFRDDSSDLIKNIWYLADSSLRKQKTLRLKKIIKALAVFLAINDPMDLKADEKTIALSLNFLPDDLREDFSELERQGVISKNLFDGSLSFAFAGSKEINEKAEAIISGELKKYNYTDSINRLERDSFVRPNIYNTENRMVRFYRFEYLDYAEFKAAASLSQHIPSDADACVVRILGKGIDPSFVEKKVRSIDEPKAIVEIGDDSFQDRLEKLSIYSEAYRKMASAENQRPSSAISSVADECEKEIKKILKASFSPKKTRVFYKDSVFSEATPLDIDDIMRKIYPETAIINNEMLNRANVSSQYAKARDYVVDFILSGKSFEKNWNESETSPQNTIKRTYVDSKSNDGSRIAPIVELIETEISSSLDKRKPIKPIVERLIQPPFGVRQGVMPLFFADAVSKIGASDDSSVILYYSNKEIGLNAENIGKALSASDGYSIKMKAGAAEKNQFLNKLIDGFGGSHPQSARENAASALEAMGRWAENLPSILRTASSKTYPDSITETDERFISEFQKPDLNPTEAVIDFPTSLFDTDNLQELLKKIMAEKLRIENTLPSIEAEIKKSVFETFGFENGSLQSNLKDWLNERGYRRNSLLSNGKYRELADSVYGGSVFNDGNMLSLLSKALASVSIADWGGSTKKEMVEEIKKWKESIENASDPSTAERNDRIRALAAAASSDEKELAPTAPALMRQLESAISYFGETIPKSDVIKILADIIKKLSQ
jgi:hypothetical protein